MPKGTATKLVPVDDTKAQIMLNVYDGTRSPIAASVSCDITLKDGRQMDERETVQFKVKGGSNLLPVTFFDQPMYDAYTVLAYPKGYDMTAWWPVRVSCKAPAKLDLMAPVKDAEPRFNRSSWEQLQQNRPQIAQWFVRGCGGDANRAKDAYGAALEARPLALACFLNIVTAMASMQLASGRSPLDYYWNMSWPDGDVTTDGWISALDAVFKQDRFFCYVDYAILQDVRNAVGSFAPEPNPGAFHGGATESYKQVRFDVANVQLTFHGHDTPTITDENGNPIKCIKIEPDIDYYKDLAAHGLQEVLPNKFTKGLTDPRFVYVLRWISMRQEGVGEFDPLYTLE